MLHYTFFGYMVAAAVIMLACVLGYRLFIENQTRPAVSRIILLLICGTSFFIPLIVSFIPEITTQSGIPVVDFELGQIFDEISAMKQGSWSVLSDLFKYLTVVYFIGFFTLLFVTIYGEIRLFIHFKKSEAIRIDGQVAYVHENKKMSTFSWFTKIFIYRDDLNENLTDLTLLFRHEKAHLDKAHWIDLAVAQIILMFQWFNPAAWFLKKELQHVHEYEADETVLQTGFDLKEYQMLLIRKISGREFLGLTDGVNNSSLKKRIIMMKKTRFKNNWVVRGLAICGFAIIGGWIIHVSGAVTSSATVSDNVSQAVDFEILVNGERLTYDQLSEITPEMIETIEVRKDTEPALLKIELKKNDMQ